MQIFHALGPIKRGLSGRVPSAFKQRFNRNRGLRAQQFCQQASLVKSAFPLPGRMKGHRHDYIEVALAKSLIVQRRVEPTRYKMTQINLATILKFVDDLANDTATAVCGHGCVEVNRAMGTVRTDKSVDDRTLERFRAFLTKWRDDAGGFCFALIA